MTTNVNIGTVWDRTTAFLGDEISPVLRVAVPFILLPQLALQLLTATGQPGADVAFPGGPAVRGLLALMIVVGIFWAQLQINGLSIAPSQSPATARARATLTLPWGVLLSALTIIGLLLLIVPLGIALAASGVDMGKLAAAMRAGQGAEQLSAIPAGLGWFIILYSLALLGVLLWLAARLMLVNLALLAENAGFGAFARSFALTRGKAAALIGLWLLYSIVAGVAVLAAQALFGSLLGLLLQSSGPLGVAAILTAIVVAAVQTAFSVLVAAFLGKLYLAARARETGDG